MNGTLERTLSKVPEVTLGFWVIKILATTLGETGGDTVTMTLNWGYLAGTLLFAVVLLGLVVAQIMARRFNPVLYWSTIVASTTFGTTMADFSRPFARHRIHRRVDPAPRLPRGRALALVRIRGHRIGGYGLDP